MSQLFAKTNGRIEAAHYSMQHASEMGLAAEAKSSRQTEDSHLDGAAFKRFSPSVTVRKPKSKGCLPLA
ncbi:MAG: hypothetical protein R3F08_13555 [Dokdonella sp.]